jgi:S1-C subfamily serine protease
MRSFLFLLAVATLVPVPASAQAKAPAASAKVATLSITVALVGENLEVTPVPLFELWLTPAGGGDPRVFRTRLDGTVAAVVATGTYRLEAAQPLILHGKSYDWRLTTEAAPGTTSIELTNANATIRSADGGPPAVATASPRRTPVNAENAASPPAVTTVAELSAPVTPQATIPGTPVAAAPGPLSVSGAATTDSALAITARAIEPVASAQAGVRQRQMAPEMEIYRQVRSGVFRIDAGLGHGSGFLVDTAGFILTNAHVVSGQTQAAADVDTLTKVEAQIVYRDDERDVAVLRVAPAVVRGRTPLPLSVGSPIAEQGERVLAIGYPLHQEQTLTSGIVSGIRESAIISDVNINHGNSGGPLMNLAGEVIGINTFGDLPANGGPGIYGSIIITRAVEPLSIARGKAAALPAPSPTPLPSMPAGRFNAHELKLFADSAKYSRYAPLDSISIGRFQVALTTPPITYVRAKEFERVIGKDRKKREAQADLDEATRYSEMRDVRDWQEYVEDEWAPVIAITVDPKLGETSGSVFRRLLVTGINGKATIRYSGDLEAAYIYRNGQRVVPFIGGTTPVKRFQDDRWIDLKDVANYGYYVLPAETFAPDADGAPPSIVIELADLKNPRSESCRELPASIVATVWNDFALYKAGRGEQFTPADAKPRAARSSNFHEVCAASRVARHAPPVESTNAPDPVGGMRP